MTDDLTRMLWVYGPPGVGKTTVAWEIYAALATSGDDVGYVDIDQLGMCFPEPAGDPGRYRLAAENLGAVVAGYRAAGARAVVVSGVVDPARGAPVDLIPDVVVTMCRLRADADVLTGRLVARLGNHDTVPQALAEAEALDANNVGDLCVDTTGLPVDQVVRLVEERTAGWTDRAPSAAPGTAAEPRTGADATEGPILWLCGASGVGKSTVGFHLYLRHVLGRGIPGAFVDLDQIGFYRPASSDIRVDHGMRARILAALWRNFRAAGARCLTVVGPAESSAAISTYAQAMPAATVTACRLHAEPDELTRRIMLRGEGGSWAQPGDPLKGQPAVHLSSVAERAVADAALLDRAAVGDVRVDAGQRTVEEVAAAVIAETGWPTVRPAQGRPGGGDRRQGA
ncbi:ATP-binding protein [Plantactinospora sonchi]|uniref:Adenylyl-sulfate kinase n=1 Tax=Plantactinospora sonchi TaxID=1544735 RepID=A0ABU7S1N1_9ACTN